MFIAALFKTVNIGVPVVMQWKGIQLGIMRLRVRSLASLSGLTVLRIRCCGELQRRWQTRLGSRVAVCGSGVGRRLQL